MRRTIAWAGGAALAVALGADGLGAQEPNAAVGLDIEAVLAQARSSPAPGAPQKKFRDFAEVTQGATRQDGLFTLYQKDEHLYAEIKPHQFDQPMLAPIAIARGMAMAGNPLNFGDEWVLVFKRAGDRVQVVRRNIHYKAPAGTPLDKAVKQNYTDSILLALPIQSINPAGQAVLIDLADIFLTDFAQLGLGGLDRSRTTWHKVKAFANNLELQVEATFGRGGMGGMYSMGYDDGVADRRGITLVIHYSLVKLPDAAYRPRYADDRVGHFLSALRDFGSADPDTTFVRQVNRWRLEKADPKAKLSAPKKQIVWYIEDNVPHEYRPFVEAGILEWNKAFEKIGFRNALDVRWQEAGRDEFDPEDINYCTFRWITTNSTYAMSGLRANPLTGEMIDGDVIFDASWIRVWKQQYAFLTGTISPAAQGDDVATARPLAVGAVISPIMAAKQGFGLPVPPPERDLRAALDPARAGRPEAVPAEWGGLQTQLRRRMAQGRFTACQFAAGIQPELALAAMALVDAPPSDPAKPPPSKAEEAKLPEEFLGQAIKEVVMHEVGHSLGLRHNFKASTMLSAEQLNDQAITRAKGNTGSVMDYNPVNIAPKGQKQGDYFTTTIGPYDYWAIEYAYKPIDGDEAAELKKIAARAPQADLTYATDEDMYGNYDPLVNTYDLGSDTARFAKDRIALAAALMKDLDAKVVKDGESWARTRLAFEVLLDQWGNGAYLVASFVGGQSVARDHKGDQAARDPVVPVAGSKQRESLKFLTDEILSDRAFQFSPALLRKLTTERWYHWGNEDILSGGGVDFPLNEWVLSIQRIVLGQCLDSGVLARLQNQELQADPGSEPLRMAEVFRTLTDGIWSECGEPSADKDRPVSCSTIRRNLQREHLRRLSTMVLGQRRSPYEDSYGYLIIMGSQPAPADARSLARMHLKEIGQRIDGILGRKEAKIDDTTRAHLEECRFRISKVLDAGLDANEP